MFLQQSVLLILSWLLYASFQPVNAFASRPGWGPSTSSSRADCTKLASTTINSDCIKTAQLLSLDSIRSTLIRQEETIIFAIIERAQFRTNDIVYQPGGFGNLGTPMGSNQEAVEKMDGKISFLDWLLIGTVRYYNEQHYSDWSIVSFISMLQYYHLPPLSFMTFISHTHIPL
jgi:hypothetical protein